MVHVVLKTWLILWVIGLPLVHIHPEADHAHGMPGHVHGGTFHTVLSSTPTCAYEDHQHHHGSFSSEEAFPSPDSPMHPPHGLEHATLTFSVLNSSIDSILEGSVSFPTSDGVVTCETEIPNLSFVSAIDASPSATPFSILANAISPRAPPILSV
jgi:hypothetical protein